MERTTAQAWSRMFAISTLLSGVSGLLAGAIALVTSPFATDPSAGKAVAIFASLFSGVFIIVFSGLFLLLGAGLWNYRSWARTTMQVIAWIMATLGGLLTVILFFLGVFALINPTGELNPAVGVLLILAAIVLGVVAWFYLWFFHFNKIVKSLFTNTKGDWKVRLGDAHRAVTQGWAINSWITAAWLVCGSIILLLYGNRFIELMLGEMGDKAAPEALQAIELLNAIQPWIVPVGIGLFAGAIISCFIGYGLWRLQGWARTITIVFAWILAVAIVAGVIAIPFVSAGVYEAGTNFASLLQYGLIAWLQIWFFNLKETKALFKPTRKR